MRGDETDEAEAVVVLRGDAAVIGDAAGAAAVLRDEAAAAVVIKSCETAEAAV